MATDKEYNYLAEKAYSIDVVRGEKEGRIPVKDRQTFGNKDLS